VGTTVDDSTVINSTLNKVSIQLRFPARGNVGVLGASRGLRKRNVSIQLGFPARGNFCQLGNNPLITVGQFPFNWDSQRVGTPKLSFMTG